MIKNILLVTFLIFSANAFADYRFRLHGTAYPELNNKVLHLKIEDIYSSKRFVSEDSVMIKNGKFSFEGTIRNTTEYATLSMKTNGRYHFKYIMLDSGASSITISPVADKSITFKNKLSNALIENSLSNQLSIKLDSITDYYYTHYSTPSPYNSAILRLSREKIIELEKVKLDLIRQYPTSLGALIQLYIIANRLTINTDDLLTIFLTIDSRIRQTELGKGFNQSMNYRKSVEIGQKIAELKSQTSGDLPFTNKSLTGQPYLIAFGATWCKPCKEDYPVLKKIYSKHRSSGFQIIGVNLHNDKKIWLSQITSFSLPWIHVSPLKIWEETELAEVFNVKYVPFYILVDKNGVISYNSIQVKDYGLKDLENYIINVIK